MSYASLSELDVCLFVAKPLAIFIIYHQSSTCHHSKKVIRLLFTRQSVALVLYERNSLNEALSQGRWMQGWGG